MQLRLNQSFKKMKNLLILLSILGLSACLKEENPDAVRQLLFECYNTKSFGDLRPAEADGLPESCTSNLLNEPFDNNNIGWGEGSTQDYNFDLSGGIYQVQIKYNGGWYIAKQFDQLASAENYQLDVRLRISDPGDTDPYSSVTWKGEGWEFLNFGISNAQNFIIRERLSQSDGFKTWKAATFSDTIRPGDWNVLSIRKFEGKTYFFINNVLVANLTGLPDFGNDTGFFLPGKSQTSFDDLLVKTWAF